MDAAKVPLAQIIIKKLSLYLYFKVFLHGFHVIIGDFSTSLSPVNRLILLRKVPRKPFQNTILSYYYRASTGRNRVTPKGSPTIQ